MVEYWADYDIGYSSPDGSRCKSLKEVRRNGIQLFSMASRTTGEVLISISDDPKYQTWKRGQPLWKSTTKYYGKITMSNGQYIFTDADKKRYVLKKDGSLSDYTLKYNNVKKRPKTNQMGLEFYLG